MRTLLAICIIFILSHVNTQSQWLRYGLALNDTLDGREHFYPRIIPDGTGGAFVTWEETSGDPKDVYIQRVNNDGRPLWDRYGKKLSISSPVRQQYLESTPVRNGAINTAWIEYPYVRVQKIDTAGREYWRPGGIVINNASRPAGLVDVTPDGAGGLYVAAFDEDRTKPWIQHVDSGGRPMWGDSCVLLSQRPDSAAYIMYIDVLCIDSSGNVYVSWIERWSEKRTDVDTKLFVQKFNRDGVAQWIPNGIAVTDTASWNCDLVKLVDDGEGGVLVFWVRNYYHKQSVQHFDGEGNRLLGSDGWILFDGRSKGDVFSDGTGGVYMYFFLFGANGVNYYEAQHYGPGFDKKYWLNPEISHHPGVKVVDKQMGFREEGRWPECELTSDGMGGLFITGGQYGDREHWVQWVDSTGTARWTAPGSATIDGLEIETNPPRPTRIHHQLIRIVRRGEAFLVWAQRNSGEKDYILHLSKVTTSGVVSVQTLTAADPDGIHLGYSYPSPATGLTTITGSIGFAGHLTLTLHDIQGRELGSVFDGDREAGPFSIPCNVGLLAPGTYYIHASNGTTRSVLPLIVYRTR